ncbi:unnamed protein product, partial [Musa hybrid cultivar]
CSLCKRRTRKASTVFITLSSEEEPLCWSILTEITFYY